MGYKDGIAYQYMRETKYDRVSISRRDDLGPIPRPSIYKTYPEATKSPLSEPPFEETENFWSILNQRRSRRRYTSEPISIETLSSLLWAIQGITLSTPGYEFRAAPSAGALYPVETYLSIHRVSDVKQGIYHFNVLFRKLRRAPEPGSTGPGHGRARSRSLYMDGNRASFYVEISRPLHSIYLHGCGSHCSEPPACCNSHGPWVLPHRGLL